MGDEDEKGVGDERGSLQVTRGRGGSGGHHSPPGRSFDVTMPSYQCQATICQATVSIDPCNSANTKSRVEQLQRTRQLKRQTSCTLEEPRPSEWSRAEDELLSLGVYINGRHWATVSSLFPDRSESAVCDRWREISLSDRASMGLQPLKTQLTGPSTASKMDEIVEWHGSRLAEDHIVAPLSPVLSALLAVVVPHIYILHRPIQTPWTAAPALTAMFFAAALFPDRMPAATRLHKLLVGGLFLALNAAVLNAAVRTGRAADEASVREHAWPEFSLMFPTLPPIVGYLCTGPYFWTLARGLALILAMLILRTRISATWVNTAKGPVPVLSSEHNILGSIAAAAACSAAALLLDPARRRRVSAAFSAALLSKNDCPGDRPLGPRPAATPAGSYKTMLFMMKQRALRRSIVKRSLRYVPRATWLKVCLRPVGGESSVVSEA